MLKGINKHIIEINQLDNTHFYKAILFVRPESAEYDIETIENEAFTLLEEAGYITDNAPMGFLRKRARRKKQGIICLAISALITAVAITLAVIL